ncbi:DUF5805 domain-containing protein [Haloarchaeobius amylolyticus]|uniref:DUF5805 domain-containing protein n=1 Tax=Haloarchaeobius amylolyticus TaxID=1198296 RepID=UPI00226E8619|nr:DUF5805 domain-containing protein [Haloarchaeobius amylolyticus]
MLSGVVSVSQQDTSRSVVKTYVPEYQKDEWADHADELDMSQSEFVRTMVQAGRRKFDLPDSPDSRANRGDQETVSGDSDSGDLTARVVDILEREDGPCTWDDLLAAVSDDIEDRLDSALQDLQADGRVRYSGRESGYVTAEGT